MASSVERCEQVDHVVTEFVGSSLQGLGSSRDEQHTGWDQVLASEVGEDGPQAAPDPVADHGTPDLAGQGERQPDLGSLGEEHHAERALADPDPPLAQGAKGLPVSDRFDQADSFARPLSRRLRSTARPARVDMRWRKPWFLARLRTLGWKVRFTWGFLLGAGSLDPAGADGGAGDV